MILFENDSSFRALTPPGFFDFSDTQSADMAKIVAWFDAFTQYIKTNIELYDSFFRLWQSKDYSVCTISRTPYIEYLLKQYGIQWFLGTDNQAAALIGLVSRSYSESAIENFQYLFAALAESPFLWINGVSQIATGIKEPAIFAENLIIFSDSVTLPTTPAVSPYTARDWAAPTGWTLLPSSSTYMSHGYLSGGNIVWMAPIPTSQTINYSQVANLASLPISPTTGDKAIVNDDGTGDVGAVYYYDGSTWRKTTTPNANQGTVGDSIPPRAVFAPDLTSLELSSNIKPPVSGPSQGYGMYGGMATYAIRQRQVIIACDLTTAGYSFLNVIIYLMRKIKPSLNTLLLNYTVNGGATVTEIEILDSGALQ